MGQGTGWMAAGDALRRAISAQQPAREVETMQAQKEYAEPRRGHLSLGGPLRKVLFLIPVVALGLVLLIV